MDAVNGMDLLKQQIAEKKIGSLYLFYGNEAYLIDTYHAFCTEMEGAGIAQAAYLNGVPFVIIRAISDKADQSDMMDYPVFEVQAAQHSIRLVNALLGELKKH